MFKFEDDLPFWSEEDKAWIIRETSEWILSSVPMIYNDRVCLATPAQHGRTYTAGFCVPKGDGITSAMGWQIGVDRYPPNVIKVAYDRRVEPDFKPHETQFLCKWCGTEASFSASLRLCAVCGRRNDWGRWVPYDPTMRFPQGGYTVAIKE
jgi:hypothetical protein